MTAVWGLGFMGAVGLFGAIGLFSQAWRARRGIVVPGAVVAIERRRSGTTGGSGMRSYTMPRSSSSPTATRACIA